MPPIPQVPGTPRPDVEELNALIRALVDRGRALSEGERAELARLTELWCRAERAVLAA